MFTELFESERKLLLLELAGLASLSENCTVSRPSESLLHVEIEHEPTDSVYTLHFKAKELRITYTKIAGMWFEDEKVTLSIPWMNCVAVVGNRGVVNAYTISTAMSNTSPNLAAMCGEWLYQVKELLAEDVNEDTEPLADTDIRGYVQSLAAGDFPSFKLDDPDTWPVTVWSSDCDLALLSIVLAGLQNVMQLLPQDVRPLFSTDYAGFFDEFYINLPEVITRITHRFPEKLDKAQDFLLKVLNHTTSQNIEISVHATPDKVTKQVTT